MQSATQKNSIKSKLFFTCDFKVKDLWEMGVSVISDNQDNHFVEHYLY